MISEEAVEAVACRVVEKLEASRQLDQDTHSAHHRFVEELIAESQERRDLYLGVRKRLAEAGMLALAGALLAAVGLLIKGWLR